MLIYDVPNDAELGFVQVLRSKQNILHIFGKKRFV